MESTAATSSNEEAPGLARFSLHEGWEFRRMDNGAAWQPVDLPHCPFVPDLDGNDHWLGVCQYRRSLRFKKASAGERCAVYFHGAMHSAQVWVDGESAGQHSGGYLPFEIDVTRWCRDGRSHEMIVELNNGEDPDVPPGKPLDELDFCWYGGLYRGVEFRRYPPICITDAAVAGEVAGGGLFVRTTSVSTHWAALAVRLHAFNATDSEKLLSMKAELLLDGRVVASAESEPAGAPADRGLHLQTEITLSDPRLWSPEQPNLYCLRASLLGSGGQVLDQRTERLGIRWLEISRSKGLQINGKPYRLRGANRHQDYPRVGYALSDAAQYRDAKLIKEAGFDYVRLSHYPQSPAFLDACDELGILVMNCIPGWQYMGGPAFRKACYQNARKLIRRDRNHACVAFWELSLNETEMDEDFMREMHKIGHQELPGDQTFTCGWLDSYDVFIHSRQHGNIHTWRNGDKAMVVAEYGDWEFYAANDGFDQKTGQGLLADWSNSRGFRGSGERKLRQQAANHIAALNDTMRSPAICDGVWSMFDYPRGYDALRAACGVMDFFRLPKFSYYFYRSQRNPSEGGVIWQGGPVVFIASRWMPSSNLDILVFSNCDEVELRLNGKLLDRLPACRTSGNQHLPRPPFVFHVDRFAPGRLEAIGYVGGEIAAAHEVATPGRATALEVSICDEGVWGRIEEADVLFGHARVVDGDGRLCVDAALAVRFQIDGGGEIIGPAKAPAEAGIASVVIRRRAGGGPLSLAAYSNGLEASAATYDPLATERCPPIAG